MKGHFKHLAMCAPMFVVAAVLIATGTSVGVLIPIVGCALMMGAMMFAMGAIAHRGHDH